MKLVTSLFSHRLHMVHNYRSHMLGRISLNNFAVSVIAQETLVSGQRLQCDT